MNTLLEQLHNSLQNNSPDIGDRYLAVINHPEYKSRKSEYLASITLNQAGRWLDEQYSTKCPADHSKGFCDFSKTRT